MYTMCEICISVSALWASTKNNSICKIELNFCEN